VRDGDGTSRSVTVNPGLSANGLVAVTAVGGTLERGDMVVVGANGPVTTTAQEPTGK
jgi:hypothetical protein